MVRFGERTVNCGCGHEKVVGLGHTLMMGNSVAAADSWDINAKAMKRNSNGISIPIILIFSTFFPLGVIFESSSPIISAYIYVFIWLNVWTIIMLVLC